MGCESVFQSLSFSLGLSATWIRVLQWSSKPPLLSWLCTTIAITTHISHPHVQYIHTSQNFINILQVKRLWSSSHHLSLGLPMGFSPVNKHNHKSSSNQWLQHFRVPAQITWCTYTWAFIPSVLRFRSLDNTSRAWTIPTNPVRPAYPRVYCLQNSSNIG